MAALAWFVLGAAFCALCERARRAPDTDFEERLAELEAEADTRCGREGDTPPTPTA